MESFVRRNMGRRIMVRDNMGREQIGMIDGFIPGRGMFIRDRFFRRVFLPFFLITTLFLI